MECVAVLCRAKKIPQIRLKMKTDSTSGRLQVEVPRALFASFLQYTSIFNFCFKFFSMSGGFLKSVIYFSGIMRDD